MPLLKRASNKARSENIRREIEAGEPPERAEAIGYSVQRETRKKRLHRWATGKRKSP